MPDLDPRFELGYNPHTAQLGSFVKLDTSTLTEYPSAGEGKYARLVHIVGDLRGGTSIPIQGITPVVAAGTAETLAASGTYVEVVDLQARKDATTVNTGNTFVGYTSAAQDFVLVPGAIHTIRAPAGKKIDLNSIWIDVATSGDAIVWLALS